VYPGRVGRSVAKQDRASSAVKCQGARLGPVELAGLTRELSPVGAVRKSESQGWSGRRCGCQSCDQAARPVPAGCGRMALEKTRVRADSAGSPTDSLSSSKRLEVGQQLDEARVGTVGWGAPQRFREGRDGAE
jgi:hypothetical protein